MISVEEAQRILQENSVEPRREMVGLDRACGHILCDNIVAPEPSPRYTSSAMDGFALRCDDCTVKEGDPAVLEIVGESQAGIPFDGEIPVGGAIRISTGAMLPDGADTVVRIEDTRESDNQVEILGVVSFGQDIRRSGEEFQQGDPLFAAGCRLGARELALLAAVGLHTVEVYAQPLVSLLVTGTELASPDDSEILSHQIRDSNSIMLQSAVQEAGALLRDRYHILDSFEDTREAIERASACGDDVILCSGGVSVGRHDHVKDAALAAGFSELFWKIRQKPGKPLFVCRKNDTLLFGLPGNPVSAFMCFNNYVGPVLAKLQGIESVHRSITAKAIERVENKGKRTNFIRVLVENKPNEMAFIKEVAQQGSHMLSTIVHADGYIILQPGETLKPGGLIEVFLF